MATGGSKRRCIIVLALLAGLVVLASSVYPVADLVKIQLEANPYGIAINPETNIAVVSNEKFEAVSIVDLETQAVLKNVNVGKFPRGVAIDTALNIAVAGSYHENTVTLVDLNTLAAIATIEVGTAPMGITVDSTAHRAYVANHKDWSITVIDIPSRAVLETLQVGHEPIDVSIDEERGLLLVVDQKDYSVLAIDLKTYKAVELPVGQLPIAIDINPYTHTAVVANEKDNSISVISLLDFSTVTVNVGKHPVSLAINELDNTVLVVSDEDRSLLVISLDTFEVVHNYALEKLPRGVEVNNYTNVIGILDDKTDNLTLIQLPNPVPHISGIEPNPLMRGSRNQTVTIEGAKFLASSEVKIESGNESVEIETEFIDNYHIKVSIPDVMLEDVGTYQVTVTNPEPEGGESNEFELRVENPVPQISMLDPDSVEAGSEGLKITIHGAGFFPETTFQMDGKDCVAEFISYRKAEIALTAKDIETGRDIKITATNPEPGGGISKSATFTVLNPVPVLEEIIPGQVYIGSGNISLTLKGDNFVKDSTAKFNGSAVSTVFVDRKTLMATVPTSMITEVKDYPVKAVNPAPGGGESGAINLKVLHPAPEIISISPNEAMAGEGPIDVTVTGKYFYSVTVLTVNGHNRAAEYISPMSLKLTLTKADTKIGGYLEIKAVNPAPGGGTSGGVMFKVKNPVPYLNDIDPKLVLPDTGSFTLTAKGGNFNESSFIEFDSIETETVFIDSETIKAEISGSLIKDSGDYNVRVINPAPGGGASETKTLKTAYPKPSIDSIAPAEAVAGAGETLVKITGDGFYGEATKFLVDGENRSSSVTSRKEAYVQLTDDDIAEGGHLNITAENPEPGGGVSEAVVFTVINPTPVLEYITPNTAATGEGGITVQAVGNDFVKSSKVKINGLELETQYINKNSLEAFIPGYLVHYIGAYAITVSNPEPGGGESVSVPLNIVYPVPQISNIYPSALVAGKSGTLVLLVGNGFDFNTKVYVNNKEREFIYISFYIGFLFIESSDIEYGGELKIVAANPAPGGGASSPYILTVNNPLPKITKIDPAVVNSDSQAVQVNVSGSGFVKNSYAAISEEALQTAFVSGNDLIVTVPSSITQNKGEYYLTVVNPAPNGGESGPVSFIVDYAVPEITSLNPVSILVGSDNTQVSIIGKGFYDNETVVSVNDVQRTYNFLSGNQLDIQVSAYELATAGVLDIKATNPSLSGSLSDNSYFFIENPAPILNSVNPNNAMYITNQEILELSGSGFVNSTVVKIDGSELATEYLGGGLLNAVLPGALINAPGIYQITVETPGPGGGISNSVEFTSRNPYPEIHSIEGAELWGWDFYVHGLNFDQTTVIYVDGSTKTTELQPDGRLHVTMDDVMDLAESRMYVIEAVNQGKYVSDPFLLHLPCTDAVTSYVYDVPTGLVNTVSRGEEFGIIGFDFVANSKVVITFGELKYTIKPERVLGPTEMIARMIEDIPAGSYIDIMVLNPNSVAYPADPEVINPAPKITGFNPQLLYKEGSDTEVILQGTGISNITELYVNNVKRNLIYENGYYKIPIYSSDLVWQGYIIIMVYNPANDNGIGGGLSTNILPVNIPTPQLTALSKTHVLQNKTVSIDISGDYFMSDAGVLVGSSQVDKSLVQFINNSSLRVEIPYNLIPLGEYEVKIRNPYYSYGILSNVLTLTAGIHRPIIDGINPNGAIPQNEPLWVTINGNYFHNNAPIKKTWVYLNGDICDVDYNDSSKIKAKIPVAKLDTPGPIEIKVVTETAFCETEDCSDTTEFMVYNSRPVLDNISPNIVNAGMAFTLEAEGRNLYDDTNVRIYYDGNDFDSNWSSDVDQLPSELISATLINATIVPGDIRRGGYYRIFLKNPDSGLESDNKKLTVNNLAPIVNDVSPKRVEIGVDTWVTVTGDNFNKTTLAKLHDVFTAVEHINQKQLKFRISNDLTTLFGMGNYELLIKNPSPGGGNADPQYIEVMPTKPVISSINPPGIPAGSAATTVSVYGQGFSNNMRVSIDDVDRSYLLINTTEFRVSIKSEELSNCGYVKINAYVEDWTSSEAMLEVTNPVPEITYIDPAIIKTGDTSGFSIYGKNFVSCPFDPKVTLNGNIIPAALESSTKINVMPREMDVAVGGYYNAVVINPGPGGGPSAPKPFVIKNQIPDLDSIAVINSLSPDGSYASPQRQAYVGLKTKVDMFGRDYYETASYVTLNDKIINSEVINSTNLRATIPGAKIDTRSNDNTLYKLRVETMDPGGGTTDAKNVTVVYPKPHITDVSVEEIYRGDGDSVIYVYGYVFYDHKDGNENLKRTSVFVGEEELGSGKVEFRCTNEDNLGEHGLFIKGCSGQNIWYDKLKITIPEKYTATPGQQISIRITNPHPCETDGISGQSCSDTINLDVLNVQAVIESVKNESTGANYFLVEEKNPIIEIKGSNFVNTSVVYVYDAKNNPPTLVYTDSAEKTADPSVLSLSLPDSLVSDSADYIVKIKNPDPTPGESKEDVHIRVLYPTPSIEISPAIVNAGATDFSLIINGANLYPKTSVTFDGVVRQGVNFVNSTRMVVPFTDDEMEAGFSNTIAAFNPTACVNNECESNQTVFTVNNLMPILASVSPNKPIRNSQSATITAYGTGFNSKSEIKFYKYNNDTKNYELLRKIENAGVINQGELTFEVPIDFINNSAAVYYVSIFNPAPSGGESFKKVVSVVNKSAGIKSNTPNSEIITGSPLDMVITGTLAAEGGPDTSFYPDTKLIINSSSFSQEFIDVSPGYGDGFDVVSDKEIWITLPIGISNRPDSYTISAWNPIVSGSGGTYPWRKGSLLLSAPVPTITSTSTVLLDENGPIGPLVINGSGFVYGAMANVSGHMIEPTSMSFNRMDVDVSDIITRSGVYMVNTVSPGPGGGTSNTINISVRYDIEIDIDSHDDNCHVEAGQISISGTIQTPESDLGITVNGIPAIFSGDTWVVNGLPIAEGANSVEVTATDAYGFTYTETIVLNGEPQGENRVILTSNIQSGVFSLDNPPIITFYPDVSLVNGVSRYEMDCEGDGDNNFPTLTTFTSVQCTYMTEGVFHPRLTAVDKTGARFYDSITIFILSEQQDEEDKNDIWERMKAEVMANNVDGAMEYYVPGVRDKYRALIGEIGLDNYKQILSELEIGLDAEEIEDVIAYYGVTRIETGGTYSYPVIFMKDWEGRWRIYAY